MDPGETKSQFTTELLMENDALKYCKAATYSDRTYDIAIIDHWKRRERKQVGFSTGVDLQRK